MKRKYVLPLVVLIVLLVVFFTKLSDFSQKTPEVKQHAEAVKKKNESSPEINTYTTRSGKTIIVEDRHPVGASLSTVIIKPVGFKVDTTIKISDIDPLKKVLIADLDQNGFDEIYLITQSAGSGSYGKVYGFASNHDKSLLAINTEEINKTDRQTDLFAGYRGHDSFSIEDGCLIVEFPVYKENDTNGKPTGGIKKISYLLVVGKTGTRLKIKP